MADSDDWTWKPASGEARDAERLETALYGSLPSDKAGPVPPPRVEDIGPLADRLGRDTVIRAMTGDGNRRNATEAFRKYSKGINKQVREPYKSRLAKLLQGEADEKAARRRRAAMKARLAKLTNAGRLDIKGEAFWLISNTWKKTDLGTMSVADESKIEFVSAGVGGDIRSAIETALNEWGGDLAEKITDIEYIRIDRIDIV